MSQPVSVRCALVPCGVEASCGVPTTALSPQPSPQRGEGARSAPVMRTEQGEVLLPSDLQLATSPSNNSGRPLAPLGRGATMFSRTPSALGRRSQICASPCALGTAKCSSIGPAAQPRPRQTTQTASSPLWGEGWGEGLLYSAGHQPRIKPPNPSAPCPSTSANSDRPLAPPGRGLG